MGELNLPKDSYSHGLRERLASEVARGSFDEGVRAIETTTGGKIPKRQAEELTAKVSHGGSQRGNCPARDRQAT
jgi:hypothetical protein